jgi:hypothetical protein
MTVGPTVETVTVATAITATAETETVGPIGQTVTAATVPILLWSRKRQGNGNGRLTSKQYKYIMRLNRNRAVPRPTWISSA